MYTTIVRRIVRNSFRALSVGNYEQVIRQFDSHVCFSFAGSSPLGGEHIGIEAVRAWFQHLYRLFPGIRFTVHQVVVSGRPWHTLVATRFSLLAVNVDGDKYENEGMQFLRLRWGRVFEDRIYEDTERLALELQCRQDGEVPR